MRDVVFFLSFVLFRSMPFAPLKTANFFWEIIVFFPSYRSRGHVNFCFSCSTVRSASFGALKKVILKLNLLIYLCRRAPLELRTGGAGEAVLL